MARGPELMQQVEALREKIAAAKKRIADIDNARMPLGDAIEDTNWLIDRLRGQVDPGELVRHAFAPGGEPGNPFDRVSKEVGSVWPVLCWLFGDQIKERLRVVLQQRAGDVKAGLPKAQRPDARLAVERELRELEISEERLISAAAEQGQMIFRRADVDPAIVLLGDN